MSQSTSSGDPATPVASWGRGNRLAVSFSYCCPGPVSAASASTAFQSVVPSFCSPPRDLPSHIQLSAHWPQLHLGKPPPSREGLLTPAFLVGLTLTPRLWPLQHPASPQLLESCLLLWAQPQGPSPPSAPQGFQQKFTFHSKEIVAISCSWCKQAVSATPLLAGCPLGCASVPPGGAA